MSNPVHHGQDDRFTKLCTELTRIDDLIEQIRWALNACQPPATGKICVMRERPRAPLDWLRGTPRLVELRWARSQRFLHRKLPTQNVARRAKSAPPFQDSYEITAANLRVLADLLGFREKLVRKYHAVNKALADIEEYTPTLDEIEFDVTNLYTDSRTIRDSGYTTTAKSLGY